MTRQYFELPQDEIDHLENETKHLNKNLMDVERILVRYNLPLEDPTGTLLTPAQRLEILIDRLKRSI